MMYGKSSKSEKKAMPLTGMVGKPKTPLPVRGQRTATNMKSKSKKGK